jgi:hypothetical protein
VLEVVQQQEFLLIEEGTQAIGDRVITGLPHIESFGLRRSDEFGVSDRTESHEPDPIREALGDSGGHLEGESGLADAAGSGQGE